MEIRNIKRELKLIDKHFDLLIKPTNDKFDIKGQAFTSVADNPEYIVTHKNRHFMVVSEFTRETFIHIRKMKYINENGDLARQLDEHNEKIELDQEKKIEDMAYNMAKDIRKPLLRDIRGA